MATLSDIGKASAGFWDPKTATSGTPFPASSATAAIFDKIRGNIEIRHATALASMPLAADAWNLLADLDKAAEALENYRREVAVAVAGGTFSNYDVYDRDLQLLGCVIRKWRAAAAALVDNFNQNARALYADKGAWAMHFSVVRMTITTFLIGISWGVISLKWDEFSAPLGFAAIVVWLMAGLFLFLFTLMTCEASQEQKSLKTLIPTAKPSEKPSDPIFRSKFVKFICFSSWGKPVPQKEELSLGTRVLIWLPFYLFLCLTLGFWALWGFWAHHDPVKKINWTVMVEPEQKHFAFTNETETNISFSQVIDRVFGEEVPKTNMSFHVVEYPQTLTNFGDWAGEIQKYAHSLSTNCSGPVVVEIPLLATNLESLRGELGKVANAVAQWQKQPPAQRSTVAVDTTQIDAELSSIVASISNLAKAMPTNLLVTNDVRIEMRNTGFLLHLGRNEVKVK